MTQKGPSRLSNDGEDPVFKKKKGKRPNKMIVETSPPSTVEDNSIKEGNSPLKSINKSLNSSQSGDHIIDLCMPKYSKPDKVKDLSSSKKLGVGEYEQLLIDRKKIGIPETAIRQEYQTQTEKFEVGCQSLSSPPVEFNPMKTQPIKVSNRIEFPTNKIEAPPPGILEIHGFNRTDPASSGIVSIESIDASDDNRKKIYIGLTPYEQMRMRNVLKDGHESRSKRSGIIQKTRVQQPMARTCGFEDHRNQNISQASIQNNLTPIRVGRNESMAYSTVTPGSKRHLGNMSNVVARA